MGVRLTEFLMAPKPHPDWPVSSGIRWFFLVFMKHAPLQGVRNSTGMSREWLYFCCHCLRGNTARLQGVFVRKKWPHTQVWPRCQVPTQVQMRHPGCHLRCRCDILGAISGADPLGYHLILDATWQGRTSALVDPFPGHEQWFCSITLMVRLYHFQGCANLTARLRVLIWLSKSCLFSAHWTTRLRQI